MEHRYNPRLNVRKNVLIHVRNSTYVSGVTRNISYGGLELESAKVRDMKKNAVVRASFMVDGRLVILAAQVVRIDDDAAALMFTEWESPRTRKAYDWLKPALEQREQPVGAFSVP